MYCVVNGCMLGTSNNSVKPGDRVSFHSFPKNPEIRKIWVAKVKREKDKEMLTLSGRLSSWEPTKWSTICSKHFADDQFILDANIARSIGFDMPMKRNLMPDAIPTLHMTPSPGMEKNTMQSAFYERHNLEVSDYVIAKKIKSWHNFLCFSGAFKCILRKAQ